MTDMIEHKGAGLISALALSLAVGLGAGVGAFELPEVAADQAEEAVPQDEFDVEGAVTVTKNGEVVAEETNVMLDGEDIIQQELTGADGDTFNTIALGDGEDVLSDHSDLTESGTRYGYDSGEDESGVQDSESLEVVDGLEPVETEEEDLGDGNWELEVTFTADETADVSTTAVEIDGDTEFGDNSDSNTFAATELGRDIPLEADDQLTVTWEIDAQNPE